MRRSYVFRMRPTSRQHVALAECVEAHRELYNAALQERRGAWSHNKSRVTYGDQSAQLKDIRVVRPDQARWSFSSQQATLRRLNCATADFFGRVKRGTATGYPRFKGIRDFDSVLWPKGLGAGARWSPDRNRVDLQGIGAIKVLVHRPVIGRVKTIQIKRQGRHWVLVLSCDKVPTNPLPVTGRQVGVDVGAVTYATLSDGTEIANPRWARSEAARLASAQQRLQRTKRGSRTRAARRETVAARHRKIANRRKDFHYKQARELVARYDLLAVEALKITNMVRRAKPKPDPDNPGQFLPNGARAKSGLNRSIYDAGWGRFLRILAAKAAESGRVCIAVDPRCTSIRCEKCGHAVAENRQRQAVFRCVSCGYTTQADKHAARNILRAGLALHASIGAKRQLE